MLCSLNVLLPLLYFCDARNDACVFLFGCCVWGGWDGGESEKMLNGNLFVCVVPDAEELHVRLNDNRERGLGEAEFALCGG